MALTIDESINPIKVTGTVATGQAVTTYRGRVQMIVWTGATTDGHLLSVTNKEGTDIWKATMATSNLTENIVADFSGFPGNGLNVNGISIDDMDSGEVLIYIEKFQNE